MEVQKLTDQLGSLTIDDNKENHQEKKVEKKTEQLSQPNSYSDIFLKKPCLSSLIFFYICC